MIPEEVQLLPFQVRDIPLLGSWLKKPYIQKVFGDPEEWLSEIEENLESADWIDYFIICSDRPIGFCQYYDTQKAPPGEWSAEPPRTAGIDYLIGEEDYLGKGFGRQSVRLLIGLVQKDPDFDYIIADPDPGNHISVNLLKTLGFIWNENGLMHKKIK